MARVTLGFEAEMDIDIPDELAARMTAQDVCDSAAMVVSAHGTGQVVMNNEILPVRFRWVMRPRHSELPFEDGVVSIIPADTFALIAEPVGAE